MRFGARTSGTIGAPFFSSLSPPAPIRDIVKKPDPSSPGEECNGLFLYGVPAEMQ